jgi:hypothetical protein
MDPNILALLKRELALLSNSPPTGQPSPIRPKKKQSAKFHAWNAYVLSTQKDMAIEAGLPPYESFPTHMAFIKAATAKGCGRIPAMKEASIRREEATGKRAYVKLRAEKWAASAEANPPVSEPKTYRQRWEQRWRQQNAITFEEIPTSVIIPHFTHEVDGIRYLINPITDEAYHLGEEGELGELAGIYDPLSTKIRS